MTYKKSKVKCSNADVAELVDAPAWGAGDLGRGGSSPPIRTKSNDQDYFLASQKSRYSGLFLGSLALHITGSWTVIS